MLDQSARNKGQAKQNTKQTIPTEQTVRQVKTDTEVPRPADGHRIPTPIPFLTRVPEREAGVVCVCLCVCLCDCASVCVSVLCAVIVCGVLVGVAKGVKNHPIWDPKMMTDRQDFQFPTPYLTSLSLPLSLPSWHKHPRCMVGGAISITRHGTRGLTVMESIG
jgi:hypothetical protein